LQVAQKQSKSQNSVNQPPVPTPSKKAPSGWLPISIVGIIVGMLFCIVIGVALSSRMNIFQPAPTPTLIAPTRISPTRTPQPSPTPSIFTGDPVKYLPNLPDNYDIDYAIPNVNTTLQDGTVLFSIGFKNRDAVLYGDIVSVVYYINIYPSEAKATSEYRKYVSNLGNNSKGTLDSDIKIEGADASVMYIEPQGNNIVLGQYVSRVKNIFISTMGLTTYDPQNVTEAFIKTVMANVSKVHILGINKLSK